MPTVQSNSSTAKDKTSHQQTDDPGSEVGDREKITSIDEAAVHELPVGSEDRETFYGTSSDGTRLILAKVKGDRYFTISLRPKAFPSTGALFILVYNVRMVSVVHLSVIHLLSNQRAYSLVVFLKAT